MNSAAIATDVIREEKQVNHHLIIMSANRFQQNVLGPEPSFVSFFKLRVTRDY